MPQIENRQALLMLGVLLLAVPLQYLVTHGGIVPDSSSRHVAFQRLISSAIGFRNNYLSLTAWSRWCQGFLGVFGGQGSEADPNGESPAVEVLQFNEAKDRNGHFASSAEPRLYRPAGMKFRIGQVIYNKYFNYRGVVIGWDPKPRAPEDWLEDYIRPGLEYLLQEPAYAVLVDVRDRMTPQMDYVSEEHIELIDRTRIMHPNLDHYFEYYEGPHYLPRPWLQWIYPDD